MKNLLKYIAFIKQKPIILQKGIRALCLSTILRKKVLRGAELAVTYGCQAKCHKCSVRGLIDKNHNEMSLDQIVGISKQIVDAGAILINLTGGEPLLRKDIISLVECLSAMPIFVSLATNGLLLTDDLLDSLDRAGLNMIQFGLASPIAKEHDQEIGIDGSYNKVISGIKGSRNRNIEVFINTVITRDVLYSERMEKLVKIAKENSCFLSLILPAQVGGWQDEDVRLNDADYAVLKKWFRYKFVTNDMESCYRRGICPAGTEKIYISPYGDLYPCPFIHKKSGNLLGNDFIALWKNMATREYAKCANIRGSDDQG